MNFMCSARKVTACTSLLHEVRTREPLSGFWAGETNKARSVATDAPPLPQTRRFVIPKDHPALLLSGTLAGHRTPEVGPLVPVCASRSFFFSARVHSIDEPRPACDASGDRIRRDSPRSIRVLVLHRSVPAIWVRSGMRQPSFDIRARCLFPLTGFRTAVCRYHHDPPVDCMFRQRRLTATLVL